jgi:hypothetical protein
MYRAGLLGEPKPTDVERLAWVPLRAIEALADGVRPAEAEELGIQLLGPPVSSDAVLFVGRAGAEYLLWRLGVDKSP